MELTKQQWIYKIAEQFPQMDVVQDQKAYKSLQSAIKERRTKYLADKARHDSVASGAVHTVGSFNQLEESGHHMHKVNHFVQQQKTRAGRTTKAPKRYDDSDFPSDNADDDEVESSEPEEDELLPEHFSPVVTRKRKKVDVVTPSKGNHNCF